MKVTRKEMKKNKKKIFTPNALKNVMFLLCIPEGKRYTLISRIKKLII